MEKFLIIGNHFSKNSSHNGDDGGHYFGIFGISGDTPGLITRFGLCYDSKNFSLKFNLPASYHNELTYYERYDATAKTGWSKSKSDCWNQYVPYKFNFGEDIYFDMVFDASENKETLYVNR